MFARPSYIVPATSAVDIHRSVVRELRLWPRRGLQCTYHANILTFPKIQLDSFHDIMDMTVHTVPDDKCDHCDIEKA